MCLDEISVPTYALADIAVGSNNLLGRHSACLDVLLSVMGDDSCAIKVEPLLDEER